MEGITQPEISPGPAGPVLRVWVPDGGCGCGFCGADAHAETEAELLAKLTGT